MFPVCRKMKTMHGPHSTCLMTAETYRRVYQHRHSRQLHSALANTSHCSLVSRHGEAIVFLGSYLFTSALFFFFTVCSSLGYLGVRLCLRFQLKLALCLIMLQRAPFEFKWWNKVCLFCLHLSFFLTGGFAFLVLSFVDT